MERTYKSLLLILLLLTFFGGLFLWHFSLENKKTKIVFLNIGQGDAILIEQGKNQLVIDGGKSGKELLARLGRYVPFWDRKIEVVVATHPDADHIGGLPALLRAYQVDQILTTGAESDTDISRLFQEAVNKRTGAAPTRVFQGVTIDFPEGGKLTVEYPHRPIAPTDRGDTNQGSIVARFVYGQTSFLLTGDLAREETLLPKEEPITVLKVAHHGSKYSTSSDFLKLIQPKEAVISVGENRYGHPDPGVIERLLGAGAVVRRTDQEGDIKYECLSLERCLFVQ